MSSHGPRKTVVQTHSAASETEPYGDKSWTKRDQPQLTSALCLCCSLTMKKMELKT